MDYLKKLSSLLLTAAAICLIKSSLLAAPYEASTLHNSVARSETVESIFFERWALIQESEWNFDFFGKINWVHDFQIYSPSRETGENVPVSMRLIRTYGGLTYLHPLNKANTILLGFNTTGYHYGLTRKTEIDRGEAGDSSVTDYKYSQFFDDIFAGSFVWKGYVYLHGGILVNKSIEPSDDGTMDYFGSEGSTSYRWFFSSNVLSFLDTRFSLKESNIEKTEVIVNVNNLAEMFLKKINPYVPVLSLGYKQVGLYNDELYDAVWVNSAKSGSDYTKESADLYTGSIGLKENINNMLRLSAEAEFQYVSETLIEKRTGEELDLSPLRKLSAEIAFNHFYSKPGSELISTIGYSNFYHEAMPVHSDSSKYRAHGFFYSLEFKAPYGGAMIKAGFNEAKELEKLIETIDKFSVDLQFNVSFSTGKTEKEKEKEKEAKKEPTA